MSEQRSVAILVAGLELQEGWQTDIGLLNCSQQEIMDFAKFVDPLPFHVDEAAAKEGLFGGIVASGAHLYIEFHKRWFVPAVGHTVLCGLGIQNWNFHQPHFPGVEYKGKIAVLELAPKPEKGTVRVHWHYTFWAPDGNLAQEIEVRVLHRMDRQELSA